MGQDSREYATKYDRRVQVKSEDDEKYFQQWLITKSKSKAQASARQLKADGYLYRIIRNRAGEYIVLVCMGWGDTRFRGRK